MNKQCEEILIEAFKIIGVVAWRNPLQESPSFSYSRSELKYDNISIQPSFVDYHDQRVVDTHID